MRNEFLPTILIEPVRDGTAARRDRGLELALVSVPVAALEREVVKDVAVPDGAVPGWFFRARGAEGWVHFAGGGRGEGEGAQEGEEEGEGLHFCLLCVLREGRTDGGLIDG